MAFVLICLQWYQHHFQHHFQREYELRSLPEQCGKHHHSYPTQPSQATNCNRFTPPRTAPGLASIPSNVLDKPIFVADGTIDVNSNWSPQVYLVDTLFVAGGVTLNIPAGTVVKFNGVTGLVVNGTMNTTGSSGSPVIFTSLKDDTAGGDTNGDADASAPAPGDWQGIYVTNGAKCQSGYTEIRYGGASFLMVIVQAYHYGNLRKDARWHVDHRPFINHPIRQLAGYALITRQWHHTPLANTTFSQNMSYGLCLNQCGEHHHSYRAQPSPATNHNRFTPPRTAPGLASIPAICWTNRSMSLVERSM